MEIGGKNMGKVGESTRSVLYLWQFNSVVYLFTRFLLFCHQKFVWMNKVPIGSMDLNN